MDQAKLISAFVEVDLNIICRNSELLAERAGVPIVAMLKADAYGLGAIAVARALANAPHVWALGVATIAEGLVLRNAKVQARLLCCTPLLPAELAIAHGANITPALSRAEDIAAWTLLGDKPWHLSVDTGMNRAGVPWHAAESLRQVIAEHPPEGVFTHHAAGEIMDTSRALQEQRFEHVLEQCGVRSANPKVLLHVDSSLGLAARAPTPFHLVRPGISLYGWPNNSALGVTPAFSVRAAVVDIRSVQPGDGVSYGGTWKAPHASRIATLAIGYGDGYRRHLSGKAQVKLAGTRCPVVGTVTMDMVMVDVSNVACSVGDYATVLGGDGAAAIGLDELAGFGGLSPYEVLVGLKLRMPPVYSGPDQHRYANRSS